jgi:hypothetical protein
MELGYGRMLKRTRLPDEADSERIEPDDAFHQEGHQDRNDSIPVVGQ